MSLLWGTSNSCKVPRIHRNKAKVQEIGKLRARAPQPILMDHQDDMLGSKDSAGSTPQTVDNRKNDGELLNWEEDKRDVLRYLECSF